jgi:diacylglycerol kinase family enzyme
MKFGKSLLIYNPVSGSDKKRIPVEFIKANLDLCGIKYDTLISEYKGHITSYLNAPLHKYNTIICSGGDGSLNEVLNSGALEYGSALILLPQGTGNDLYRSLNLLVGTPNRNKLDFNSYGKQALIDTWLVEGTYSDGTSFSRRFCNAVGTGLDSLTAKYVTGLKKRNNFSYITSLLKAIFQYKVDKAKVHINGETIEKKFIVISIHNGKCSGGGFYFAPDAELNDGKLDICFINELSKLRVICNFTKVLSNRIKEFKEVELFRTEKVCIELEGPYYLHIDGEIEEKKVSEIRVSIYKERLKVYFL